MILWNFKNWIYLYLINPLTTYKKAKGVFKPLQLYFRCGKNINPDGWYSKPAFLQIVTKDVSWKDKYDTPRFESSPCIWIHFYKYDLIWYWGLPTHQYLEQDEYWEQLLWYVYYYNTYSQGLLDKPDINKARESWPWTYYKSEKSTWNDKYLIK